MTVDRSTPIPTELAASSTSDIRSAVVELRGATLAYGNRVLWRDLDLDLVPGEFVAVLGPNGSGKTSLLRVLLGLQQLSSGSIRVIGEPPGRANERIGYIPQQRA